MKKIYITPVIEIEKVIGDILLAGSGVTGQVELQNQSYEDLSYGGIDEEGNLDPSANSYGCWDDDSWGKN